MRIQHQEEEEVERMTSRVMVAVERIATDHLRGSGNLRRDLRTFMIRRTL